MQCVTLSVHCVVAVVVQVSLEKYLSNPSGFISAVPSQSELPAAEPKPARPVDSASGSSSRSYSSGSSKGSSGGGKSGGLGPGEIAGAVVGSVAGAAILGALAYFVGYKKLFKDRQATSYKRGEIPDGPSKHITHHSWSISLTIRHVP